MAKFFLINTVLVGTQKFFPGQLVDDSNTPTAPITTAGGLLWPDDSGGAAVISGAAAKAQAARLAGASEVQLESLMQSAVQGFQKTEDDTVDAAALVHVTIDLPLATIQAKTSGAAFNIGAALPANARLISSEVEVIATVTGGSISACKAKVQNTGETAGAIEGGATGVDVFTATGKFHGAGTNPAPSRGGQQLQMTLTSTADTLANATTGHLALHLFYHVLA